MAGIHSLPPEVLVKIFVLAGSTGTIKACLKAELIYDKDAPDPPPRRFGDLYALATSSRFLYATFKANEYQIWLDLVKDLAFKFKLYPADSTDESTASLFYRTMFQCQWGVQAAIWADMEGSNDLEAMKARIERLCRQDIRQIVEPWELGATVAKIRDALRHDFIIANFTEIHKVGDGWCRAHLQKAIASLIDSLPDA
jgi:hypothetical protein